jgi:hypothetical protein
MMSKPYTNPLASAWRTITAPRLGFFFLAT